MSLIYIQGFPFRRNPVTGILEPAWDITTPSVTVVTEPTGIKIDEVIWSPEALAIVTAPYVESVELKRYVWSFEAGTSAEVSDLELSLAGRSIDDVVSEVRSGFTDNLASELVAKAQEQGATVSNAVVTSCDAGYTFRSREILVGLLTPVIVTQTFYKVWVRADVSFDCDKELMGSPLDPVTIYILTKVISAIMWIIIAWFAITAIIEWLKSMTTKKTTVTKIDPVTGLPIVEETVEPSPLGIVSTIGSMGLLLIAGVLLVGFAGRKRG